MGGILGVGTHLRGPRAGSDMSSLYIEGSSSQLWERRYGGGAQGES